MQHSREIGCEQNYRKSHKHRENNSKSKCDCAHKKISDKSDERGNEENQDHIYDYSNRDQKHQKPHQNRFPKIAHHEFCAASEGGDEFAVFQHDEILRVNEEEAHHERNEENETEQKNQPRRSPEFADRERDHSEKINEAERADYRSKLKHPQKVVRSDCDSITRSYAFFFFVNRGSESDDSPFAKRREKKVKNSDNRRQNDEENCESGVIARETEHKRFNFLKIKFLRTEKWRGLKCEKLVNEVADAYESSEKSGDDTVPHEPALVVRHSPRDFDYFTAFHKFRSILIL